MDSDQQKKSDAGTQWTTVSFKDYHPIYNEIVYIGWFNFPTKTTMST